MAGLSDGFATTRLKRSLEFGSKMAGGATLDGRQKWMLEGFFERFVSITAETILVQEKSIWCEMFQHSATKTILVYQKGFWCTRNDSGVAGTILVRKNGFWFRRNESFVDTLRRG
jgi:hypothetical protein